MVSTSATQEKLLEKGAFGLIGVNLGAPARNPVQRLSPRSQARLAGKFQGVGV